MSGVGSTNAMKKGSANNPFLAYSEVDMASFLNSAYTGCIVKYAGEPISRYLTEQNKTVPEHVKNLVFSPTDGGFWEFFNSGNIRIKIQQKTNGSTKTLYITPGRYYNGAWHFDKLSFTNGNLYLTDSLTAPTEIPIEIQKYFDTEPYWRWNKECVNDQGNLTIWTYDQDVTFTIEQATTEYGIAYDSTHGITVVPYKVNELYKVVYGDGKYYYEEFCHISDTRTTANSDYIAPGKTAFDFTGNLQTGNGSKINPYLAYTVAEFQSFPVGSFIKWLGPNKTILDETTGQMLIQGEVYRAVEDGDVFQYAILPTLSNPADPIDVAEGKEVINQLGAVMIGTGNNILQASTTAGMQALFIDANMGKIAKYVGETDVYIKDAFYLITSDANAKQYYELPVLTNEGTAADLALGKELINSKGIKIVGTKMSIGLEETSWEKIREIVLTGNASRYWNIGDTKSITSKSGKTYTIRLADLQNGRYEYSDGSGSSKAVFEFVECYNLNNTIYYRMNSTATNIGGWAASEMRSQTMPTLLADLPDDMVAVMSQVKVLSSIGGKNKTDTSSSNNTLFIPATIELFDNKEDSIGLAESPLGQFDYYKANNIGSARVKYVVGETTMIPSKAKLYWNRSPYAYGSNAFCGVEQFGDWDLSDAHYSNFAIAPIFAI